MSVTARPHPAAAAGFRHHAFFYAGLQEFLAGALRFLRAGIARGEPSLVVVSAQKIDALRTALGEDAAWVRFEDMRVLGANPARIIPAWKDFVEAAGGIDQPLRGIGEPVWAGRSAAELVECHRHEALLNLAFADAASFDLLCPYDTSALPAEVLAEARRTHPLLAQARGAGDLCASDRYLGLTAAAAPCCAALTPAPSELEQVTIDRDGLGLVRAVVTRRGVQFGLAPERVEDLVLAVNELATNSILHGGGSGVLRVWEDEAGGGLVCEVHDGGRMKDPLAGRERPAEGQIGRYGLWLVNQLCDFVEQRTLPGGNLMRVTMRRGADDERGLSRG